MKTFFHTYLHPPAGLTIFFTFLFLITANQIILYDGRKRILKPADFICGPAQRAVFAALLSAPLGPLLPPSSATGLKAVWERKASIVCQKAQLHDDRSF